MRLTEKQRRVLNKIQEMCRKRSYPPSVREIGEAVGLSPSGTTHRYMKTLKDRGYIEWEPDRPRTLKVIKGYPIEGVAK